MAGDLLRLGITTPETLAGQDPDALYERLCRIDRVRHDPGVRDVFATVVSHVSGGPAEPW